MRASISATGNGGKPDMMATHPSTPERIAQAVAAGAADRRAGRRRDRPRRLSRGDRRHRLRRRSRRRGWCAARASCIPSSASPSPRRRLRARKPGAALIGVGEGGAQALRLDSIAVDGLDDAGDGDRLRLDRRACKTDLDRDPEGSTTCRRARRGRAGRSNGASGSAPSGSTAGIYRLIFAAHSLTPAVDARFLASIAVVPSHQRRRNGARPQPQRIQIVEAAGRGDTPETLARADGGR